MDKKEKYSLQDLCFIMETLRGPGGCPWDCEQNHDTLKGYLIEETYEVIEAINLKDDKMICEELGDVLLQVVFHSSIAKGKGAFNIDDVIKGISEKMILRHPHVFGNVKADTSEEVLKNWDEIKKKEKGTETQSDVMKKIPKELPALLRSYKVQQKAAKVGFDWDNTDDVIAKIEEELCEVKMAIKNNDVDNIKEELGDLLFAVVNLSRFVDANPELSLDSANEKFIRRFEFVENNVKEQGMDLMGMSLAQMDEIWNMAKKEERKNEIR
ncbi:MAG TPA: nucleoside triphosphate pyrophosphohydrolase [Clostridia bacterium]|nr:nucleoside triphosphate pyrophosphohydrolase [Clostridia bacterium]